MILRSRCSLIFIMLTALYTYASIAGMDTQPAADKSWLMGLNTDVFKQVLSSCDADDDKAIIYWTRCRQVCKAWCTLLSYQFMADQIGFSTKDRMDWTKENLLGSAVCDGKKGMVGLLCRLYPNISKDRVLEVLFVPTPESAFKYSKKSLWLRQLLQFGAPTQFIITYKNFSYFSMEWILTNIGELCEEDRNACFDLLLEYGHPTEGEGLLVDAAHNGTLHMVLKLLDKPLCKHSTNMSTVLEVVCGRHAGELESLHVVVGELLKRGAEFPVKALEIGGFAW